MAKLRFRVVQDWALETTKLVHPDTNDVSGSCSLRIKWENVVDHNSPHDKARYTITDVELEADEAILQAYPWGSIGAWPLRGSQNRDEIPLQVDGEIQIKPPHGS